MEYNIKHIADRIGSKAYLNDGDTVIKRLLTDSRSLVHPEGTLFFALKTRTGDGHNYIKSLYDAGVRNFVVSDMTAVRPEMIPEANVIVTDDTLEAMRRLAIMCRNDSRATVIAITGSRGKTTVKEWLANALESAGPLARSPRSYNSQTGVPLSLWGLAEDTRYAIIEAGISQPGEMAQLEKEIRPEIGIFTNIGAPHSRGFESIEQKCREKAVLMKGCRSVVFSIDNELISASLPAGPEKIAWTLRGASDAAMSATITSRDINGTIIEYAYRPTDRSGRVTIPFTSDRDIENAMHTLTTLLLLDISEETIINAMASLRPVVTRLEVADAVGDCQLIHDRFTGDMASLASALDFARRRITPGHTLTLITGDPEGVDADYDEMGRMLKESGVKRIIGIGPEIHEHRESLGEGAQTWPSVTEFLADMSAADFASELILIKGSRVQPLTEVARLLERKRHETVLEINLDAVVDNFNYFRSLIRPTTGMVCMIKASGYGAGSHELAKTLQSQGASYLAVAVHDEGVDLRQAGITMPIIVLNPAVDDLKTIFDHQLEPEIYSIDFLRSLIDEARRRGNREYPVHIKIDSGMHRLGFRLETLPEVIELLKGQDHVVARSIFSHLCAADDPAEDEYTRGQFDYFDRCASMLLQAFPERRILRHILNSTGITRFPEHQYDMVRLGIGLYGIRTMHDGSQDALRPVSALRTSIISLKRWPAGTTIGYNRRGRLERESVIATIPIGYADGLNRHLGYGNTSMNVRGVMCPTVGSICMDACMIDVTDVPDVSTGDRVEIFGDTIPVDSLAETLGTIPYEVLTSVSPRVKRIYFRE